MLPWPVVRCAASASHELAMPGHSSF